MVSGISKAYFGPWNMSRRFRAISSPSFRPSSLPTTFCIRSCSAFRSHCPFGTFTCIVAVVIIERPRNERELVIGVCGIVPKIWSAKSLCTLNRDGYDVMAVT